MNRYVLDRVSMIVVLFIIVACNVNSGSSTKDVQKKAMNDTLKIHGCQDDIKAELGSTIEIKLEATPSTGYQWLLKDSSQLLKLLDPENLKFSTADSKEISPGQPGYQVLLFKVIKKGEETLQFEYKRTWEKEILKTCSIKLEVK